MRTTIELPDNLLRRAKITAVKRGTTLRQLVSEALEKELGSQPSSSEGLKCIKFPVFSSEMPGSLHLTNADLAKIEAEEDVSRHGFSD